MIKKIGLAILAIVVIVLAIAATKPDTFSIKRSASIKAPPEKIAALLTDFHRWGEWSPWEHLDPDLKRSFSGPAQGQGAVYNWSGNSKAGVGRMEIVDAAAPAKTVIKLDFIEPFASHNMTVFNLQPQGEQTNIVWEMSGPMPFISKVMSVFVSMDAMIGKDFEQGLVNLKTAAEK